MTFEIPFSSRRERTQVRGGGMEGREIRSLIRRVEMEKKKKKNLLIRSRNTRNEDENDLRKIYGDDFFFSSPLFSLPSLLLLVLPFILLLPFLSLLFSFWFFFSVVFALSGKLRRRRELRFISGDNIWPTRAARVGGGHRGGRCSPGG